MSLIEYDCVRLWYSFVLKQECRNVNLKVEEHTQRQGAYSTVSIHNQKWRDHT